MEIRHNFFHEKKLKKSQTFSPCVRSLISSESWPFFASSQLLLYLSCCKHLRMELNGNYFLEYPAIVPIVNDIPGQHFRNKGQNITIIQLIPFAKLQVLQRLVNIFLYIFQILKSSSTPCLPRHWRQLRFWTSHPARPPISTKSLLSGILPLPSPQFRNCLSNPFIRPTLSWSGCRLFSSCRCLGLVGSSRFMTASSPARSWMSQT